MNNFKVLSPLVLLMILAGCQSGNSSNSNSSLPSAPPASFDSVGRDPLPDGDSAHEYIFSDVNDTLSSNYQNAIATCDDAAFSFMSVSKQSSGIINVPVLNASLNNGINYVEMLSDAPYDLNKIGMCITLYTGSDYDHLGDLYDYIGMDYYYEDTWVPAGYSINRADIFTGALQDENTMFVFNVPQSGVRSVRMRFEGIPHDAEDKNFKVRFGIYSMYIEGTPEEVITSGDKTTSVTIDQPSQAIVAIKETLPLTAQVGLSDGWFMAVKWSSSDRTIATVDEKHGVVKGVREGNVTITATSGSFSDSIDLIVTSDSSVVGFVQPLVLLPDADNLPIGFTTNSEESYGDAIKLYATGHFVKTPIYAPVMSKTRVIIDIKHSTVNTPDAANNVIAVVGYDESGAIIDTIRRVGFAETSYTKLSFEFTDESICQYAVIYESKSPYGKNYGIRSIQICNLR